MNKGGKRAGAGRKSKAEELGLNDLMDSIGPTENVLKRLYSLAVDQYEPNQEAIKLWMGYKFGTPKQSVNVDSNVEVIVTHES